jgi:hypothetical protein
LGERRKQQMALTAAVTSRTAETPSAPRKGPQGIHPQANPARNCSHSGVRT